MELNLYVLMKNIPDILLTLVILIEDKSIDFKNKQSENIKPISLTLAVLNEFKSIVSNENKSRTYKKY